MKIKLCILIVVFGNLVFGQVPTKPREIGYDVAVPPREKGDTWTSVFSENGKFGAKVNDTIVLEPIYQKIHSANKGFIIKKDNKFGFVDFKAKSLIPIIYDSLSFDYSNNYFISSKKSKKGIIDRESNIVVDSKFDDILYYNSKSNYALVKDGKSVKLYFGKKEINENFDEIIFYQNGLVAKQNGKYGWHANGKTLIPFQYESIGKNDFKFKDLGFKFYDNRSEMKSRIVSKDGKFGIMDELGNQLVPTEFNKITYDSGRRLYQIQDESKLIGLFLDNSKVYIKPEFQAIHTDGTSRINVMKNGKYGLIDYKGNYVIPAEFDEVLYESLSTGFKARKNGKYGWLNTDGSDLIPFIYDKLETFYGDKSSFTKATQNGKIGVIGVSENKIIVPIEFDEVYEYYDRNFLVRKGDKVGLIDVNGRYVTEVEFDFIKRSNTENSSIVFPFRNGLYSLVDKEGNLKYKDEIKSFRYILNDNYQILPYASNLPQIAIENSKGKIGILNEKTAEIEVPMIYDEIIQKFDSEKSIYFIVRKGDKVGVINQNNEIILPFNYSFIDFFNAGYNFENEKKISFVAKKGKKMGVINLFNETLIPFEYKEISKISRAGLYKAKKDKTFLILNENNQKITPIEFDEVGNFEFFDEHNEVQRALTFKDGKMTVINDKGEFVSYPETMNPHQGFAIFDDLKAELIRVLNSSDDNELKLFVDKVAPSDHILYFFRNLSNEMRSEFQYLNTEQERQKYYDALLKFKYSIWSSKDPNWNYDRGHLTDITDFTIYEKGLLRVKRAEDWAYGDRFIEKFLRNSIKVNGFWISSYFAY